MKTRLKSVKENSASSAVMENEVDHSRRKNLSGLWVEFR